MTATARRDRGRTADARRPRRIFILSPARLSGARGRRILAGGATSSATGPLSGGRRAKLGEIYSSISTLYFRGKLAYARTFAAPGGADAVFVITPDRGLLPADVEVGLDDLRRSAEVEISKHDVRYVAPLVASAEACAQRLKARDQVVLLGSIATGKYVVPLGETLGDRLLVPRAFVGLGEMQRGSLLLRAVADREELAYVRAAEVAPPLNRPRITEISTVSTTSTSRRRRVAQ